MNIHDIEEDARKELKRIFALKVTPHNDDERLKGFLLEKVWDSIIDDKFDEFYHHLTSQLRKAFEEMAKGCPMDGLPKDYYRGYIDREIQTQQNITNFLK